jgi:hypothetical protein
MRPVSRVALVLTVLATAGGCVTERAAGAAQPADLILSGRVVSAAEVTGMMGDVAVVWDAYVVAPLDGSDPQAVIVDVPADCLSRAPASMFSASGCSASATCSRSRATATRPRSPICLSCPASVSRRMGLSDRPGLSRRGAASRAENLVNPGPGG